MNKSVFYFLLCIAAFTALFFVTSPASADIVFSLLRVGSNQASDENREYLIDRVRNVDSSGNPLPAGSLPTVGKLDVGDSLRGTINITTINSSSGNVGGQSGNDELTGVFQLKITGKTAIGGGLFLFTFGPDPAFEADLGGGMTSNGFVPGPGAILVLFEDSSNNFAGDFNDPAPAISPAGPDDGTPGQTVPPSSADVSVGPYDIEEAFIAATASDGDWFATLGFKGVSGEGAAGLTSVPNFDNVLKAFTISSGSAGANTNLALSLLGLGPAAAGLQINKSTVSPFGGTIDFALSQQTRGVYDLDTPFELSSNTNISFVASFQSGGACRMTGGSETQITDPIYGPTYVWVPGSYTTSADQKQWVTTGGQIGAPLASPTGPSFGEWTHQLHCTQGSKGNCPGTAFAFDFKAGTASNKGTIINTVVCGDQGYCVPARCAPFKQIFWDGIGVIKNIKGTFPLPTGVTCTNMGEGTFHYFKAHVGDFGEPGSTQVRKNQPPTCSTPCPWTSGGVDISNIVPLSPVSPAPNNTIGGQICPCGCGDWYEIEIHCTTDPTSSIIYRFAHLIDTGDLQIHPPVGDSCH